MARATPSEMVRCRCGTHIFAPVPNSETDRGKVVARLEREGWRCRRGGKHDVYKHPARPGRIVVPRQYQESLKQAIASRVGQVEVCPSRPRAHDSLLQRPN